MYRIDICIDFDKLFKSFQKLFNFFSMHKMPMKRSLPQLKTNIGHNNINILSTQYYIQSADIHMSLNQSQIFT